MGRYLLLYGKGNGNARAPFGGAGAKGKGENFQSNFQPVRSTGTYHEKLLSLELTMRVFLVERAHHGFFC